MSHGTHEQGHGQATFGVHGMLLVGQETLYLSHLPMFMAPHNFQVLLEVALTEDALGPLRESRSSAGDGLYTVQPERFHITELISPGPDGSVLGEFRADLFQGHFEKGGKRIAQRTPVAVVDIAYFRQLDFDTKDPDLTYVLFGKEGELFLAHRITSAPDFDQLVSAHVQGLPDGDVLTLVRDQVLSEGDRFDGLQVTFDGRDNAVDARLKPGERLAVRGHVAGRHSFFDLEVEVLDELYFEEGELAEQPSLEPTEEETAAGFGD